MDTEKYLGAVDTQTADQKEQNYKQEEFVSGSPIVVWYEKPLFAFKKYSLRDQANSGSCVTQTFATELEILAKQKYGQEVIFSAGYPYQNRRYPKSSGCTSEDVYEIFPKIGDVTEKDMISQYLTDASMMKVPCPLYLRDQAKTFKAARISHPINFDKVAETISKTDKGVMVWFKFSPEEWGQIPSLSGKATTSGHSVTAVDFTLYLGKKYLVVQDSWLLSRAFDNEGHRLISEEFFNERCFLASYLMNFKMEEGALPERPHFDESIMSAQRCFKWEGLFPSNVPEAPNWGNITRTAAIAFQKRYGITPAFGNFGPITIQKLKELYP